MDNKPYDGPGAVVKYDGAPYGCGCDYLVGVGYWTNKLINIRTFSKVPRALRMNGDVVSPAVASQLVGIIQEQFPHEGFAYEVTDDQP